MTLKNTTRKEIRDTFKSIGYKVTFKRASWSDDVTDLGFIYPDTGYNTLSANVFHADTYNKHRIAFELLAEYRSGYFLTDTEQRIIKT